MMPPNCWLCDRGQNTGDECELIYFARTPSDQEWHDRVSEPGVFSDHPPDCGWFCDLHADAAKSLVLRDITSALDHLRTSEAWLLIYIDLFDRETPPLVQKGGVGFESGFVCFWDQMLATIETNGIRYPSDFRLSFNGDVPDYSLNRGGDELMVVKKFLAGRDDALQLEQQIAKSQAQELRAHGHPALEQWLTDLCALIAEGAEPDLLKRRKS